MQKLEPRRIFVSIGSRFTMDRLLKNVDEVMEQHPNIEATAQIGNSSFKAKHFNSKEWVGADAFEQFVRRSEVFISHAGMGNILMAAKYEKPIIIMPRLAKFHEHINDHQLDTTEAVKHKQLVKVANDVNELEESLMSFLNNPPCMHENKREVKRNRLINSLKQFIDSGKS